MPSFSKADKDEEATIELPRNRMETVMVELPVGKVRFQGSVSKSRGKAQQMVMIVEIDALIIVQAKASELVKWRTLLKSHQHRIEEVLDETIRSAKVEELNEPDGHNHPHPHSRPDQRLLRPAYGERSDLQPLPRLPHAGQNGVKISEMSGTALAAGSLCEGPAASALPLI